MKELDFNCEAQYAARFRQQFLDDENVEVPEVIWDRGWILWREQSKYEL